MIVRSPKRDGLTLIEVILAMAIFMMSYAAISRLVDLSAERVLEVRFRLQGTRLAQSKMDEVYAGVIPLEGDAGRPFEGEEPWRWAVDVQPGDFENLYRVTVTVSRELAGRDDPFEVRLTRLLIDPATRGNLAPDPAAEEESAGGGDEAAADGGAENPAATPGSS